MKTLVLLNAGAGAKVSAAERIRRELPEATVQELEDPLRLITQAREGVRRGFQVIAAGGGDGTISSVATALVGTHTALGVLPLGTLNHFAKDMRIPLDLAGALRVLREGHTTAVDVGEVNGHVFLNNSSLGLYPRLARLREKHRKRGLKRAAAFFWAAMATFRRYPYLQVKLNVEGVPIEAETPVVFVGNNVYHMEGLRAGSRPSLTEGHLCLCVAHTASRLGLMRLAALALFGRLHHAQGFQMLCTAEATVETRRRHVRVATDGEVHWMRSPLHYKVRPGALRVVSPR